MAKVEMQRKQATTGLFFLKAMWLALTTYHKIHGTPKMNFRVFLIRAARLTMRLLKSQTVSALSLQ